MVRDKDDNRIDVRQDYQQSPMENWKWKTIGENENKDPSYRDCNRP